MRTVAIQLQKGFKVMLDHLACRVMDCRALTRFDDVVFALSVQRTRCHLHRSWRIVLDEDGLIIGHLIHLVFKPQSKYHWCCVDFFQQFNQLTTRSAGVIGLSLSPRG